MATTEEKIRGIICDQLQVDEDEVTPGASLRDDLGADSLDMVELTMVVEEDFDIEISNEDADKIKTVQDVYDYIAKRVK